MSKLFYRFRSLKSLFDHKELENQNIYFASHQELNDPMEDYKDLLFIGNETMWKSLFRHYLMCLEHVSQLMLLCGEEHCKIDKDSIPIFKSYDDFPTSMYKEHFEEIEKEFFSKCDLFVKKIATRTTAIRKDELIFYLDIIHNLAIAIIHKSFEKRKFIPKSKVELPYDTKQVDITITMIDMFEELLQEDDGEFKFNAMIEIQKAIHESISFNQALESKLFEKTPNRNFVLVEFIQNYTDSLEKLMYPEWYTACFMSECTNSSVWGHYGDSHQGVCLIFESFNETLKFENRNNLEFKQVNYKEGFVEIDFFHSLGRLPIAKINSVWSVDFDEDEEKWRKQHWESFYKKILTKTDDWEYEKEYRLILSSVLNDNITFEERLLKYEFSSLKGLIFGMKTSISDKVKIVEIIRKKCKEHKRDDFEFYQAYYSHRDKNIQHRKIGFLDFKNR